MVNTKAKSNSIEAVIKNIEKQMGNDGEPVVFRMGDRGNKVDVPAISFGCPEVDQASYCNGVPQGKLVEIFGPESSGKSYLSLKLIASAQKMGKKAILFDIEQSFDPSWAKKHGVDIDDLYIVNDSMSAEKALDYVVAICDSGSFSIVVIDSTAALTPNAELEGSISDQTIGLLARVMSKACRHIIQACGRTGTTCVFINQIRDKIGGMTKAFGDSTTTPGGRALKFYSHQRINVIATEKIKIKEGDKDVVVARKSIVKFIKNKVARPFGECVIEIVFDETLLNPVVRMCNVAKEYKIIGKRNEEFRISKDLSDDNKPIETHTKKITELADYLVKNNLVEKILDATIAAVEESKDLMVDDVDDIIYKIKENPKLIVSPFGGCIVEKTNNKAEDADEKEEKKFEEEMTKEETK